MLGNLRHDVRRLKEGRSRPFPIYLIEGLLFDNGFQAVVFYRIARWFKKRSIPFFGPLVSRIGLLLTGADISPGADVGPGLLVSHGVGLVVGGYAEIGSGVTLLHGVTIGAASQRRVHRMPKIGDEVFIGAGAKILGGITIGDGAFIGANALVGENVPPRAKVVARGGIEVTVAEPPDAS